VEARTAEATAARSRFTEIQKIAKQYKAQIQQLESKVGAWPRRMHAISPFDRIAGRPSL
jgi:hypothetical protein